MQRIHASQVASISELKRNPSKVIENANGEAVAILNHNTTAAYIVPTKMYEKMLELMDDSALIELAEQRINDAQQPLQVDIDDL